jgi:serine/threonine protein kinase
VIHRDLKLSNILVSFPNQLDNLKPKQIKKLNLLTEELTIKIADLGFSRQVEDDKIATSYLGTPLQMAPELLFSPSEGYDSKVDVWALGALFYTMLTGKHAFYAPTREILL